MACSQRRSVLALVWWGLLLLSNSDEISCFSIMYPRQSSKASIETELSFSYQSFSTGDSPTNTDADNEAKLPKGRRTRPRFLSFLFDDTLKLLNPKTMSSYQVRRKAEYGPVFKTNIFFRPTVFVTDEANLKLLGLEEAAKDLRAFFPPHHQTLFGEQSAIVQSGAKHKQLRRVIQSSMSPTVIRSYQDAMDASFNHFFEEMKRESDFVAVVPKIRSLFISLTLDLVLGAAKVDDQTRVTLVTDIAIWAKGLLAPPLTFVPWSTASKALRARKRIVQQLNAIIDCQQTLTSSDLQKPTRGLIWSLLFSEQNVEGGSLSREDVIDNIFTILFAGSDTTASACISLWRLLSLSPPELKLHIRENPTEQVLNAVIGKVFQTSPPAPFSMRLAAQELTIGDYTIPKDWLVVFGLAGALSGGGAIDDSSSLSVDIAASLQVDDKLTLPTLPSSMAFGTGPRRCPGRFLALLEIESFLKKLCAMDWELMEGQNLEQRYTPGLFPVDGLVLRMV